MSTPFQNRLVGTIIVAAIAIIFLPDLLDGEKKTYQDQFSAIPEQPQVSFPKKKYRFPEDKLTKIIDDKTYDDIALDDEQAQSSKNVQAIENTEKNENETEKLASITDGDTNKQTIESSQSKKIIVNAATDKKVLPEKAVKQQAWVIQLGSFRHQQNVDDLLKRLKSNGYTAFTQPIKTKNGKLVKVFVGPELIKSSLEKKLPTLKDLTKVEGKITRFYPTK